MKNKLLFLLVCVLALFLTACQSGNTNTGDNGGEDKHTHEYTWTVKEEATCTKDGVELGTCECGETTTRKGESKNGHTEVDDAAEEATCTEAGKTAGKHCSVCGDVLVTQEVVPAKGHEYTESYYEVQNDVLMFVGTCSRGCDVTYEVEVTLEINEHEELVSPIYSTCELPYYLVMDQFGNDLSEYVVITDETDSNAEIEDVYLTSKVLGTHTIKYAVVDRNNTVASSKTVTVNFYEKILRDSTVPHLITVANETTDPLLTNGDKGLSGLSFNVDAGKYYYVEMTMLKMSAYVNGQIFGLSHNNASNGIPTEGLYYTGFKFNASNYEYAHSKYVEGWNYEGPRMWMSANYANNRVEGINANPLNSDTKLAVARAGDKFYYFVNDKLYHVAIYPELENNDTYPGLIFFGNDTDITAEFKNFKIIREQDDIESKIADLVGNSTFEQFGNWGNKYASKYATFNDDNGFTFHSAAELETADGSDTNNAINDNMVSPYFHLYGNWEVSYDVALNVLGDNGGWGALWTDIRTVQDSKSVFSWRDRGNRTNYFVETEISSSETGDIKVTSSTLSCFERSNGAYHVTIRCELMGNNVERYTITVTAGENNAVNMTQVFEINYTKVGYTYGGAKYFIFKSQKWAGTISNFAAKNI